MMANQSAIAVDLDGTILNAQGTLDLRAASVLTDAATRGVQLVAVTGRGAPRMEAALRDHGGVLSGSRYVAVEQGGRVLDKDRREIYYQPIFAPNIHRLFDALPAGVEFIAFHPRSAPNWSVVWSPLDTVRDRLRNQFKNATFVDEPATVVRDLAVEAAPCMITVRLLSSAQLTDSHSVTWMGQNLTLVASPHTKAEALAEISKRSGFDLGQTIVAGDDWPDAPMLALVPPANRIVVGQTLIGSEIDGKDVLHCARPEVLPEILRHAIGENFGE